MKKIIYYILLISLITTTGGWADAVTLNQFLEKVSEHSKDLKLAAEDLNYAKATKKEAVSGALPSISADAGYNRNLKENYLFIDDENKFKINRNNEYSFNVTLNQTLFSGAVYNAIRAAREYTKLTEYVYQASENEIMTMAKKSFYQTLLLKQVFEVTKKSEANALDNYTTINNGFELGLKSEFEKLQAEVRYKDLIPQTTETQRNYDMALINLKNMAGIDLEADFTPVGSLENFPEMPANVKLDVILNQRPDYNAILWEEKLRSTGVRAERAGYIPTLTGYFAYNYSAQSDQFKFENENNSYTLGLNLSIPIFSGGSTRAKVQQAKINLKRTRITRDKTVDNIKTETKNIRLRLVEAYNRIESARSSFTTAQKAFTIAEATSESGLTTQLELKDSRIMLDQAEVNFYSAIYEYLDAYFDWEKAIGEVDSTKQLEN